MPVNFRPFADAREYVRKLKLKKPAEWREYSKSRKKPQDIPIYPEVVYRKEWKGWGDWLGIDYISPTNRKYRSFKDAREFVHTLGLKNSHEWQQYVKSGK